RGGEEMSVMIAPRPERVDGETIGLIGIGPPLESMARRPVGFVTALSRSSSDLVRHTTAIYKFIKDLVSGQVSGRALAGPVAIAQMAGRSAQQGWERLVGFMAMLSVNLAVLNLLPIPMLDGGHLMILSVEAVVRRSLSVRQKEVLQQVGFAFLIFLMIYVTFGDISRIFGWFN
ncbi:MAG: RIP metalloprotease, partial [Candidatus Latescibacteria bacterium]|nr:RIP metalloprotease [Candidatus Latescibacterota bacterium]